MILLASTGTACTKSRCIFSKRGLFEGFQLRFIMCTFTVVLHSIPFCSWDQSFRGSVCLTGVHVAPRPGVGTGVAEITWGATGSLPFIFFKFHSHHVPVSSQHSKEPNGTCQRLSKKCTLKWNQWLTQFSRRIGELRLLCYTDVSAPFCRSANTQVGLTILRQMLNWWHIGGNPNGVKPSVWLQGKTLFISS